MWNQYNEVVKKHHSNNDFGGIYACDNSFLVYLRLIDDPHC